MCGIAGVVALGDRALEPVRLRAMTDAIAHRGPDDAGYLCWQSGRLDPHGRSYGQAFSDPAFEEHAPLLPSLDSAAGRDRARRGRWDVMLGHRRLSIIDLAPTGHQPMSDLSGRSWIAYNGEVYNFRELRRELEGLGHEFVSQSDTEVVLSAYAQWGIDCLRRLNGMFAFALYDDSRRRLFLARDRYGIKPLYLWRHADRLSFGSEIKSLLAGSDDQPDVDLLALNEYFSFQNVFSDRTLFDGIRMLPAGHWVTVDLQSGEIEQRQWWDFDFSQEIDRPGDEIRDELTGRLCEAVERQCVSDVPIGCYLSGGMDSGTITAVVARRMGRICSFTGGFDLSEATDHELSFDERESAERMSKLFQTEHYECVLHSGDLQAVMDELVWHLEDLRIGQCYPNYYVSRLASKFVKVVMAGTGGDELFGGYPWRYAAAVGPTGADYIDNYYWYWQRLVRNLDKPRLFTPDTVDRLKAARDEDGSVPFINHTLNRFRSVFGREVAAADAEAQVRHSLYFECKTFLHGLLVVEDKLSMAHGLETRVPFLDNELVDFASTIPIGMKVTGLHHLERLDENLPKKRRLFNAQPSAGKSILRDAMANLLPEEIVRARKQGFSAPDESWFRGSIEQYLRDLLLQDDARCHAYLSPDYIREVLDQHSSGAQNRRLLIWSILCFETWCRQFGY